MDDGFKRKHKYMWPVRSVQGIRLLEASRGFDLRRMFIYFTNSGMWRELCTVCRCKVIYLMTLKLYEKSEFVCYTVSVCLCVSVLVCVLPRGIVCLCMIECACSCMSVCVSLCVAAHWHCMVMYESWSWASWHHTLETISVFDLSFIGVNLLVRF